MQAITLTGHGGPEVMEWAKVPDPTPGPGEVIVEVAGAGVNRADLLQRQGLYPPPPGASDILGLECSGTITNVGAALPLDRIGERVCALLAGGGYAQKVAVPVGQLMSVPAGVSLVDAGGLAEVACTVWSNLDMVANLSEGEWLLVHGGGSGIGTMAIQVARMLGARVAVTAGSAEKRGTQARRTPNADAVAAIATPGFRRERRRVRMKTTVDVAASRPATAKKSPSKSRHGRGYSSSPVRYAGETAIPGNSGPGPAKTTP